MAIEAVVSKGNTVREGCLNFFDIMGFFSDLLGSTLKSGGLVGPKTLKHLRF